MLSLSLVFFSKMSLYMLISVMLINKNMYFAILCFNALFMGMPCKKFSGPNALAIEFYSLRHYLMCTPAKLRMQTL